MKKIHNYLLLCLLLLTAFQANAQKKGYNIKVTFSQPLNGNYVYLAHYYAKGLPTIYKVDSARVDNKKQQVIFQRKDSLLGGVYLVLLNNNSQYFEILLDNGDAFEVQADTARLPLGLTFKNSTANERYMEMNNNFIAARTRVNELKKEHPSEDISSRARDIYKQAYQKNLEIAHAMGKHTLLSKIIYAFTPPNDPDPSGYTRNGEVDSMDLTYLLKEAYWDNYDLSDDRLIHTPFYENKLKYYFDNYVYNYLPDSVIYEAEKLLYLTRNTTENFKFTLQWLTNYTHSSKIMGMDIAFVHLAENYHMQGKAYWLDSVQLKKVTDRAITLAPNVIGRKGENFTLYDLYDLRKRSLYDVDARYILLVFWSIDCGHCLKEVPQLKALYDSTLKAKGVKVFSVPTGEEQKKIQEKVAEFGIGEWTHVIDLGNGNSDYIKHYDAYTKPKIYLLDKDKIIRGKNLGHENISQVIEALERREHKH